MRKPKLSNDWLIGFVFVAVAMSAHFLLGADALVRVLGAACVATGVYWVLTRRIPVGWEGRPPSFHITGAFAVAAGIAMFALGVMLVWFAPDAACVFGWSESSACYQAASACRRGGLPLAIADPSPGSF